MGFFSGSSSEGSPNLIQPLNAGCQEPGAAAPAHRPPWDRGLQVTPSQGDGGMGGYVMIRHTSKLAQIRIFCVGNYTVGGKSPRRDRVYDAHMKSLQ
jgi:hypothetical protein